MEQAWSASDEPGFGCFLRGTRLMAEQGDVAIETVRPGTRLVGRGGVIRTVVWSGCRRLDPSRHPCPAALQPVRIRRAAVANGVPQRDLLVSPDQVLSLAEGDFRAATLVNGATIRPEPADRAVEYWQIVVDGGGDVLAESLSAATLAPGAPRHAFHSTGPLLLHPVPCAPMPSADPLVRRRLLQRAQSLGHAITRDPALTLLVEGRIVQPLLAEASLVRFELPPASGWIEILSRAGVPAEMDPGASDRRRLGVQLSGIVLRGPALRLTLPLTDKALGRGFHPVEPGGLRWTDGRARLTLPAPGRFTRLDLLISAVQPSWAQTAASSRNRSA
jgi:hypothetical protein